MASSARRGFTLVELLVVIAIIGLLVALLLPAVQMAREAARATTCKNHLRQVALGTELFYDANQAYPPGRIAPRPLDVDELSCGGAEASWMVRILPFVERGAIYDRWDVEGKWYEQPQEVLRDVVPFYLCPSRRSPGDALGMRNIGGNSGGTLPCGCPMPPVDGSGADVLGALGDYAGNLGDLSPGAMGLPTDFYHGGNGTGILVASRSRCIDGRPSSWIDRITHAQVSDGLSNTILVGEKHIALRNLKLFPEDSPIWDGDHFAASMRVGGLGQGLARGPYDLNAGFLAFGSAHPTVVHFAMGDASVRAVRNDIDNLVLGNLTHRGNGE